MARGNLILQQTTQVSNATKNAKKQNQKHLLA